MSQVELRKVTKLFDATVALDELSLSVSDGEVLVVAGSSGSGKSTLLNVVAGLESVASGKVMIGGRNMTRQPPGARDVAMVFQGYALYPHLTVFDNLAYGLRSRGVRREELRRRVAETAAWVGVESLLDRFPRQLSGGQRQRVAVGRALARLPRVFLLDEPLSSLDAKLRVELRADVARILHSSGKRQEHPTTSIYVTHDPTEALAIGDRICVLREGRIEQLGTPKEIYSQPSSRHVAELLSPLPLSVLQGKLERDRDALVVRFGEEALRLPPGVAAARPALASYLDRRVEVGVRSEHARPAEAGESSVSGRVVRVEMTGTHRLLRCEIPAAGRLAIYLSGDSSYAPAQPLAISLAPEELLFFDPDTGAAIDGSAQGVWAPARSGTADRLVRRHLIGRRAVRFAWLGFALVLAVLLKQLLLG
jgi:multiple sugar transport system ATP-binding protein